MNEIVDSLLAGRMERKDTTCVLADYWTNEIDTNWLRVVRHALARGRYCRQENKTEQTDKNTRLLSADDRATLTPLQYLSSVVNLVD